MANTRSRTSKADASLNHSMTPAQVKKEEAETENNVATTTGSAVEEEAAVYGSSAAVIPQPSRPAPRDEPRIALNPRDDEPRGGQPVPDQDFYNRTSYKDSWGKENIARGFDITFKQYEDYTKWMVREIRVFLESKGLSHLALENDRGSARFGPILDAFEQLYVRTWKIDLPRLWKERALWGWIQAATWSLKNSPENTGKKVKHDASTQSDDNPGPSKTLRNADLPLFKNMSITFNDSQDKFRVSFPILNILSDSRLFIHTNDIDPDMLSLHLLHEFLKSATDFDIDLCNVYYNNPSSESRESVETDNVLYNAVVRCRRNGDGTPFIRMTYGKRQ